MTGSDTVRDRDEVRVSDERREAFREGLTMALYVGLSLQAVLLVTPPLEAGADPVSSSLTIFLTAIGLLVAHQVALRLSTKLVNQGRLDESTARSIRAQTLGGLPIAFIVALPVLIAGTSGLAIGEVLLLAFVSVVGYLAARAGGASRARSAAYVVILVVVVAAVLALKIVVHH